MQFKDLLRSSSDVEQGASEPNDEPVPGKYAVVADMARADRDVIAEQVRQLGYVPLTTDNGSQVVGLARQRRPRFVVANLELEGAGGRDVLAALRGDPATRDVAVVLISNTSETPDMAAGSQLGADDYICKPIDGATVKARIRKLLLRGPAAAPGPPGPVLSEAGGAAESAEAAAEPLPAGHIERAEKLYAECRDFVNDAMARATNEEPPDIDWCRDLATRLVQECELGSRLLLKAIRPYEPGETSQDAPNVAIFSIKIGRGLNYDAEELTALAMAALCHEVGMSCVPADVVEAQGKYTKKQSRHVRQHPEHARKILSKLGEKYEWLTAAVYEEHERVRGQGYPRGLTGEEICEFAKIIGLADTYESLSHPRTFRKAFIAFDALREIIGMRDKFFPAHVIRALVSEVSVFPLESYVLLNTGETARVVKTNPDNLLRPAVVVEYDASGQKRKRPKLVDLASWPLLYVTKPADERDLVKSER
ncbi:MAG: HD domain-containing phosphohydrolase [Planctomycetota bacterium]